MDLPLPCPLSVGWELVRLLELSRTAADGRPYGGFSAAAYQARLDRLWLLSDAPTGHLVPWGGLAKVLSGVQRELHPGPRLLLRDSNGTPLPPGFDGEGLVVQGDAAWIVSEGRRTPERRARLIRITLQNGRIQEELALPEAWLERPGQGLDANRGPESLTALAPGDFLLGAEAPLQQQSSGRVVALARRRPGADSIAFGALDLGPLGPHDGLTALLALPSRDRLLALRRGYELPSNWSTLLQLFPLPRSKVAPPLQPLIGWDLQAAGLPPDNWEALAVGPVLSDGRPTLVLASDDNFNPLQTNWVAVMAPQQSEACTESP